MQSPLHRIVDMLTQITCVDKLEATTKKHLEGAIKYASEMGEKEEMAAKESGLKVSEICEAVKIDLVQMYDALASCISGIQNSLNAILANMGKVLKEAEDSKAKVIDLASKVGKVTEATNKIASETRTYWDVLLAAPKQTNRMNTDPRILNNLE
jgi:hypothetical protein